MAYDRAQRRGLPLSGGTGPNVSPNSYHVNDDSCCCCKGTNWVPFLTCSGRPKAKSGVGPGPNSYFPKINKKIIGGASMLYTEPRFPGIKGSRLTLYDPYHDSERLEEKPMERLKGYMYHCCVPYTMYGYMPTIPDKGHLGYMICDDGKTLAKCCYSDNESSLGGGFYAAKFGTFCSCYKGCFWSRSTSKRYNPVKADTPGVGTYDIEKERDPVDQYLDELRHQKKKKARLLRYVDELQCVALRNNYPAPNSYDIRNAHKCLRLKKVLVPKKRVLPCRKVSTNLVSSPAPNSYTDPRTALEYLVKPSCVKNLNAFLVNAPRFLEKKTQDSPGPDQYHIKSFVEEAAMKISPYAVRKTAFDTSVPKKLYYLKPVCQFYAKPKRCKCSEIPVPGQNLISIPPHPIYPFSSKVERFKSPKELYQASCASYNIASPYDYLHEHKSFRKAARNNFLSSEKRFFKLTNFSVVEDKSYIPGPTYDLSNFKPGRKNNTGTFTDQGARFRKTTTTTPGPLTYRLHPVVASAIPKRSYNVTLEKTYPLSNFQQYRIKLKPKKWVKRKAKVSFFNESVTEQKREPCGAVQPLQLNFYTSKPNRKKRHRSRRTRRATLGFELTTLKRSNSLEQSQSQIIHSKIRFE